MLLLLLCVNFKMGKRKSQLGQDKTCYIGRAILNKNSPKDRS